jgi:mono/diheme cytochrome c family protein
MRARLFTWVVGTQKLLTWVCITALWATGAIVTAGQPVINAQEAALMRPEAGTSQIIAEGQGLYVLNGCYVCHGINATGRIGPDLTKSPLTDQGMFDRISHGKPGTTMGPFKDKITPDEIWKIIAYLRSLAHPHVEESTGCCPPARALPTPVQEER